MSVGAHHSRSGTISQFHIFITQLRKNQPIKMNRIAALLHIFFCAFVLVARGEVKVEDTYVPAECDAIASPSDHVLM